MMEYICPCLDHLAEVYAQRLIDGAIKEVGYFCCFNSYATKFEEAKRQLIAERKGVEDDIADARERNEIRVEEGLKLWIKEADDVINEETKTSQKCVSGLCPDCIWQHHHGKELEQKTQKIAELFLQRRSEFPRVARPPPRNPGIKYYAPQNFIDFSSRKSTSRELVEALVSGNSSMIGLHGLAGMGKTTLALQVGVLVNTPSSFQEVVFTTVSDRPDLNKIRRHISEQLNIPLDGEEDEERRSKALWSRIDCSNGKVLIILDDIWSKLELRDIGVPHNHKNCRVLITTCNSKVCRAMGCLSTIPLNSLEGRDGLDIFKELVGTSSEDSTSEFIEMAKDFVNVCGGLTLTVVSMANTFKGRRQEEWKNVLKHLQNSGPHNNGLKLSYKALGNEAKYLLLLCSLFPKDNEIPMELLSKLGIGFLFRKANSYSSLREELIQAKYELISSSFLQEPKKACVKMHDLVRKLVLSMKDKHVQVIMNPRGELKSKLKYLSWSNSGFPNHFDGAQLEVLLAWIKGRVQVEDSYAIFEEMAHLRVLFLRCDEDGRYPILSFHSFISLKNIRTLILNGWRLGDDISNLEHLNNLVTLEFESCLIMELPREIVEIESMRFLGIRRCKIMRNNAFKVISSYSRLEELYFVENDDIDPKPEGYEENEDEVTLGESHAALQMYSVAWSSFKYFVREDNDLYKCFNTEHMENLMSKEMFKYLVEGAELLEVCNMGEARWKSLVPDMKGLIKLALYDCADIEFLLDNRESSGGDEDVFSSLVELHLVNVGAKHLRRGAMPSGFLSELKILKLLRCMNLRDDFFHSNLKLPQLTVLQLDDCPMFTESIFLPSVARSLVLLEELFIKDCKHVKTVITDPREDVSGGSLFPKLKSLKIEGCGNLQVVLSVLLAGDLGDLQDLSIRSCGELKYIFGEYKHERQVLHKKIKLPSLTTMELEAGPNFINICKTQNDSDDEHANSKKCCCLPSGSMERNETPHPADQGTKELLMDMQNMTRLEIRKSKIEEIFNLEGNESEGEVKLKLQVLKIEGLRKLSCIYKDPKEILNFCDLKVLVFSQCDRLTAIFSASTMKHLSRLSHLEVTKCEGLVSIIEVDGDDDGSRQLCLPMLQTIRISRCNKLKSLFSISTTLITLEQVKILEIEEASDLEEVFGCRQDYIQERRLRIVNVVPQLSHFKLKYLPKLERFCGEIDAQSIQDFVVKFDVVDCGKWGNPIELTKNKEIEKFHVNDVGTSTQVPLHSERERESNAKGKQKIETQGQPSALPNFENIEEVTRKTGEQVPFSETSAAAVPSSSSSDSALTGGLNTDRETMKTQANDSTSTLEKKASETSPAESEMTRESLHSNDPIRNERAQEGLTSKDDVVATPLANIAPRNSLATLVTPQQIVVTERIPEGTAIMERSSQSSQSTTLCTEQTMETQTNGSTPVLEEKAPETSQAESQMTRTPIHSNGAERNKRVQEELTPKDDGESTSLADIAPRNSQEPSVTPQQTVTERIPEDTAIMERSSQSSQSTTLNTKEAANEIVKEVPTTEMSQVVEKHESCSTTFEQFQNQRIKTK